MVKLKSVFILLGPSGVGKTSVGKDIVESSNDLVMFLSTGKKLWETGTLEPWTDRNKGLIKERCHEMISNIFENFEKSTSHVLLVLDCVKDLLDAEYITQQTKKYGFEISQALQIAVPVDSSNVDAAESLQGLWKMRGAPTFGLQMPARVYLGHWQQKFNAVKNYYQRMNLLAVPMRVADIMDIVFGQGQVRIVACPDYVQFLLLDSARCEIIHRQLLFVLCLSSFEFSLPVSFVHSAHDFTWVTGWRRYHVAQKIADVVRFLLCKVNHSTFLINDNREIFPCDVDVRTMPDNTIFDGELLPSKLFADIDPSITTVLNSTTSVFVVCDVLAASNQMKWALPFSMRQKALMEMNIDDDITAAINKANMDNHAYYNPPVHIVKKKYHPSTPTKIISCLSPANLLYQVSGLVFTPEMPYKFGEDSLGFQWCQPDKIRCAISTGDLLNGQRPCHQLSFERYPEESVIECQWIINSNEWQPLFGNHVKAMPDSDKMIDHLQIICQQPYDGQQLKSDVQTQLSLETSKQRSCVLHPSLTYDFDELYDSLKIECVKFRVKLDVDPSTNLELFNCVISSLQENEVTQLCHGFVLHPESTRVVTMPFTNFNAGPANMHSEDVIEATVKFDGTFCVAFLWNDEVTVATKDSMNSRESSQAKKWIKEHCDTTKLKNGYTYIFEMIFKEYRKIVEYPFEGLVLLSVSTNEGLELSYNEMLQHSQVVGFPMVTPRISGRLSEVLWYCAGMLPALEENDPPESTEARKEFNVNFSGAMPASTNHEGWVVRFSNGTRKDLVHSWWNKACLAVAMVLPQIVWLLVKYNRIDDIFKYLPNHFQQDLDRMINVLGQQFLEVLMEIRELQQNRSFSTSAVIDSHQQPIEERRQRLSDLAVQLAPFAPDISGLSSETRCRLNISPLYIEGEPGYNVVRIPILDFIRSTRTAVSEHQPNSMLGEIVTKYLQTIPANSEELEPMVIRSILDSIHGPSIFSSFCIPDEILLVILKFLNVESLIMMSRVCRKFHKIILGEEAFERKISNAKIFSDISSPLSSGDYYSQDSYS